MQYTAMSFSRLLRPCSLVIQGSLDSWLTYAMLLQGTVHAMLQCWRGLCPRPTRGRFPRPGQEQASLPCVAAYSVEMSMGNLPWVVPLDRAATLV